VRGEGERGAKPARPSCLLARFSPSPLTLCTALALLCTPALAAQAPIIDHVQIERRSVFEPDELGFWPLRIVNKLHITTRPYVVRRELLFRSGEPYDSARVEESERNLRRLGVFRLADVDSFTTDSGLVVRVVTRDGWSTRPDFRFRSTGGDVAYTVAMIEDNLLGTATQASLLYQKNPDRSTTTLGFRQPRLINNTIGLNAQVQDRSDGELAAAWFGKPFFSIADQRSWSLEADTRTERVLRFREGIVQATDTVQRRYVLGRVEGARALRASPLGYLRVGVTAQVRRDDFVPQARFDQTGFADRSVTGAVGAWIEARTARFEKVRGYNALSRDEDFDLSTVLRAGVWVAPTALGYERSGIGPELSARTGLRFGPGFATAGVSANGLFTSTGLDSGSVAMSATVGWLPSVRHLAVVHASVGAIQAPRPGSEFDIGLGIGPRAFRQHAFTGDRAFFLTAEYRYGLAADWLKSMDLGIATFADYGGAWYHQQAVRTGGNVGVGLRIGASRAPDIEANRLDLAWRFANDAEPAGWVFVVAKGFAFGSSLRGR
jgi:hypothetical protein